MIEVQVPTGALVFVGDGRKALFLRNKGAPTHVELSVERVLQHEDAPTREQGTDRPGRYQGSDGVSKSAFEEVDWHQLAEDRFAAEIGGALNRLAYENRFHHLILVAPPKVLGAVRTHLNKETSARVVAEVPKDLTSHPVPEIARTLSH
ncbi:MAG TPA: host attachment family protein [Steroidobacteraceae bacterium]